jgi:hypothetical protein
MWTCIKLLIMLRCTMLDIVILNARLCMLWCHREVRAWRVEVSRNVFLMSHLLYLNQCMDPLCFGLASDYLCFPGVAWQFSQPTTPALPNVPIKWSKVGRCLCVT